MEGGDKGLCLLSGAYWSASLDGDDWGVRGAGLSDLGVFLRTESCDVSPLVALEAESALDPLLLVFIHHSSSCPSLSDVHGIRVAIVKRIPPLHVGGSSASVSSLYSFLEEYVLLLMSMCHLGPIIPHNWVVKFYTVGHQFV